ncbi:MAG: DUF4231 domain-containing protein [Eubacteriales bacterium]|nr:DUF4231 domain-containing protein [Eubacteriales bacterium]
MNKAQKEIEDNKFLFEEKKSIVDQRFEACCKWYIRKACKNKMLYMTMTFLGGLCPIFTAVLTGINFGEKYEMIGKAILIILSLLASISVLVLNVTRAQEKWISYRASSEFLKRERVFYLNGKDSHKDSMDEWDERFLQNMEKYMEQENKEWIRKNSNSDNDDDRDKENAGKQNCNSQKASGNQEDA